jgi:hypothetical protein
MKRTATLSTVIDADVKRAVTLFCKRRGLKLQYLVEKALVEQLEDEIDLDAYTERSEEPTVSLEKVMSGSKRKKA